MRTRTTGPQAIGPRVAAMTQFSGRQPHRVRATISRVLRKKLGLNVSRKPSGCGRSIGCTWSWAVYAGSRWNWIGGGG